MVSLTVSPQFRDEGSDDDEPDAYRREREPDESSHRLSGSVLSAILPVEQRLRSRIDKFLAGFGLSPMGTAVAINWIQTIGSDTTGDFARVRGWLVGRLNAFGQSKAEASKPGNPWQRGCPEIIPGLRSKAFWSADGFDLPWVADFEKGFIHVREELLALRGSGGFQPYRAPGGRSRKRETVEEDGVGIKGHRGGDWNVFYLFLHNTVDFSKNRGMCPKTVSLVEALPRHHKHAFFSALAPGTHVMKHNGPTNKKLRVHMPILAPARGLSRLRVGEETREVVAGRALVFDDSFEHEAWNDSGTGVRDVGGTEDDAVIVNGDTETRAGSLPSGGASGRRGVEPVRERRAGEEGRYRDSSPVEGMGRKATKSTSDAEGAAAPRVTLIADVWHPDLSNSEVRFMTFLQDANLRLEKRLVEAEAEERKVTQLLGTPHEAQAKAQAQNTGSNNAASETGDDPITSSNEGSVDGGRTTADNFWNVIDRARGLRSDESNIFGK
eukprot:g10737.t1